MAEFHAYKLKQFTPANERA